MCVDESDDWRFEWIDTRNNRVLLTDGTELPIAGYMDVYGNDCDPSDAVVIVAGTDEYGWLTIEIDWDDMEPVTVH